MECADCKFWTTDKALVPCIVCEWKSEWEPVDNCIQITHYYAGYRVDGVPAMTENRRQLSTKED